MGALNPQTPGSSVARDDTIRQRKDRCCWNTVTEGSLGSRLQGCFCLMGVVHAHSKAHYCKQEAISTSHVNEGFLECLGAVP